MAKHRKTRKEKVRSDIRQEHVIAAPAESPQVYQEATPFRFTFSPSTQQEQISVASIHPGKNTNEYAFVGHDLRKTGMITAGIIIAELALFAVIR